METKSASDHTLFLWNLILFGVMAFALQIPFWRTNFFEKVANGSAKHVLLGIGYLAVFVGLPLWALSWTLTKFIVTQGQIRVIDWFGLRQNKFTLPDRESLKIKNEKTPYQARFFPVNRSYTEFRTLYLTTMEGRRLRIQSRYYKNFDDLCLAIKKACY